MHRQGSVYKIYRICQYLVPESFVTASAEVSGVYKVAVPNENVMAADGNGKDKLLMVEYLRTREYMLPLANFGEVKGAKYENINVGMKAITVSQSVYNIVTKNVSVHLVDLCL